MFGYFFSFVKEFYNLWLQSKINLITNQGEPGDLNLSVIDRSKNNYMSGNYNYHHNYCFDKS